MNKGIIRKVDRLGRIVIPKEIRLSLMIKDEDNLEMVVDNDSIILKKYSHIDNLSSIVKTVLDSLKLDNIDIIIYDSTNVTGSIKNIIRKVTPDMLKYIPIYHSIEEYGYIDVINTQTNYYIKPIISNGVFIANILAISDNKLDNVKEIINYIASFLGKYMEI